MRVDCFEKEFLSEGASFRRSYFQKEMLSEGIALSNFSIAMKVDCFEKELL